MDRTVELEQLENVLHVRRPVHATRDSMIDLSRVEVKQAHASRVQVQVGKVSAITIKTRTRLSKGDAAVPSNMSAS